MTSPRNSADARRIARGALRRIGQPLIARVRNVATQVVTERLVEVTGRIGDLEGRTSGNAARIEDVVAWHADLGAEFRSLRDRVGKLEHELSRVGAQLAALDTRVAEGERPPVTVAGDGAPPAEAIELVEEIRAEHQRVRARLTAVASYEERIGRLEERLPS